ncbi:hypothetical protein [Pseudooceanicola atlanticus]|jgi:hypothetical protein|uniref:hypothetical protein n=1 Tax=Pseudooceanicola atlanticus TaxID=1461694 RepID=UPI000AC15CF6|nr:hypothetical protein [Pseudooceanicola atlanticus]
MFDPVKMIYYAAVCATLAVLAPRFHTKRWRMMIGAVVGLVAAGILPFVNRALGM